MIETGAMDFSLFSIRFMHEAIISEEEYWKVQALIHKGCRPIRHDRQYALKSLVVCGSCGRRMERILKKPLFACRYRYYKKSGGCSRIRSPKETELEKIVFNAIHKYMELVKL